MPRVSKRIQLLQAAAAIVDEQGSEYLTLDAVAKKAGVSKGGLLYHFKNKFALIQGLVDHADELYRENVNGHGRLLKRRDLIVQKMDRLPQECLLHKVLIAICYYLYRTLIKSGKLILKMMD